MGYYIILDVETTGLDVLVGDSIIELAYAVYDENHGMLEMHSSILGPSSKNVRFNGRLSAQHINGISLDMIDAVPEVKTQDGPCKITNLHKDGGYLIEALDNINLIFLQLYNLAMHHECAGIMAHYSVFDKSFVIRYMQSLRIFRSFEANAIQYRPWVCTKRDIRHDNIINTKNEKLSLNNLAKLYGIAQQGAHRAYGDVLTLSSILDKMRTILGPEQFAVELRHANRSARERLEPYIVKTYSEAYKHVIALLQGSDCKHYPNRMLEIDEFEAFIALSLSEISGLYSAGHSVYYECDSTNRFRQTLEHMQSLVK